jgi:hypothetical protein
MYQEASKNHTLGSNLPIISVIVGDVEPPLSICRT